MTESPYAVLCPHDGKVLLTQEQHDAQMNRPDARWQCSLCGGMADWDDDHYETALEAQEEAEKNP